MKKISAFVAAVCLAAFVSLGVSAQTKPADTKPAKPAKAEKPKPAPKSDAEIEKCITDKLAASPKLKDQKITVSVSGGVATLTGEVNNGGSKGAATNICKSCGAKSTKNNITVKKAPKPEKPKKPADPKKPA
jgi:osmotically-inducible protein OsmY